MDWHARNVASYSNDLRRFHYTSGIATIVECCDLNHQLINVGEANDDQLRDWSRQKAQQEAASLPDRSFYLVILNRHANALTEPHEPIAATLNYLPVEKRTFSDVMNNFQLSRSFIETITRGGGQFSSAPTDSATKKCFNMRMDHSFSRDLALSTFSNLSTGQTFALILGCDEQDRKALVEWLRLTTCSAGHPHHIPTLFAELQLRRYKTLASEGWTKLMTIYAHTGQFENEHRAPESDLGDMSFSSLGNTTKILAGTYQSTGFLEKSVSQFQRDLLALRKSMLVKIPAELAPSQKDFLVQQNKRIQERLDEMIGDCKRILAECKMIIDGASLLTGIIWNLIAQHNNTMNRSIAADSRLIAEDARRDSAAMKSIALTTMLFLPSTFIAAFFALPLFNWDAKPGDPVLLNRFWIFWAVSIPLTAIVLTTYLFVPYIRIS